ncbi:retrovirus-related pol polyprotein from transposon TNT 1-94 [Tanacetum coccineum]
MLKTRDGVTDIRFPQRVEDLVGQEKLRYDSDIKAVNILLLGFPVDIYTLINHYQTAKEIGDRVKELMEGTKMTKQERESMRYDELDKFTSEPGESIHSYYLRYTKLINDMKMIPMSMSNMQINTKFVNHLQPEWSSQQKQYHTQPSEVYQPYQHHQSNTQITQQLIQSPPLQSYAPTVVQQPPTIQPDTGFVVPTFLPTDDLYAYRTQATIQNGQVTVQNVQGRWSQGDAGNAGKNQASGVRTVNPVGNTRANQPRAIRCYNCNGEGHIAKQCTAKKRVNESLTSELQRYKDRFKMLEYASRDGCSEKEALLNRELRTVISEQLYWSSTPSPPESISKPTKVFPKKLPSTSQVLKNMNNARDLLSNFNECIKRRTTLSPYQIGSWDQSDIKGAFKKDVIPFFENLKETFKLFEKGFIAEVKEMKDIFEQMKDGVDQCSMIKKCFEIEKKQLLINNDRLLEENMSCDIMCTYLRSLNEVDIIESVKVLTLCF